MKRIKQFFRTKQAKAALAAVCVVAVLAAAFFLAPGARFSRARLSEAQSTKQEITSAVPAAAALAPQTSGLPNKVSLPAVSSAALSEASTDRTAAGGAGSAPAPSAASTAKTAETPQTASPAGTAARTTLRVIPSSAATQAPAKQTTAARTIQTTQKAGVTYNFTRPTATTKPSTTAKPSTTVKPVTAAPATAKPVTTAPAPTTKRAAACTVSIRCDTVWSNADQLSPERKAILPSSGVILAPKSVTITEGESVFDVLQRLTRAEKIHLEFRNVPLYNSAYIEGIANLYEFDCGPLSGWMYTVNGAFPNYGSSKHPVKDGDVIVWMYTCDLGKDIGGGGATGQRPS
ncbi:MAG: DUF4430 domain-containing protein [Oscillospiraceae bacterium]|jgi:hypothetical protein|nr:DUF4430 domain-containing protein [Oscillospiraceae bacterium]